MSLGSRIKEYRKKRGYTQSQMASKLNMTEANFSSYERDKSTPPGDKVSKIASILNVSTDYLLGKTEDPTPRNYFIFRFDEDGAADYEYRELNEEELLKRKVMLVEKVIEEQIKQLSEEGNFEADLVAGELINLKNFYIKWAYNKYRSEFLEWLDSETVITFDGTPISQSDREAIKTVVSSMFHMKRNTNN